MNKLADALARSLREQLGLPFVVSQSSQNGNILFTIQLEGVPTVWAFQVEMTIHWRHLAFNFQPGPYSKGLIQAMGQTDLDSKAMISSLATVISDQGGTIGCEVNGVEVNLRGLNDWPENWNWVLLQSTSGNLVPKIENALNFQALQTWLLRFMALVVAFLKLETSSYALHGAEEGAPQLAMVRRYERSAVNRIACLEIHGVRCKVCNVSFSERYPAVGDGFIHVHHLEPVSLRGEGYVLNPSTDLIPVCPNCHSMLHRRNPPYLPEELLSMCPDLFMPN